MDAKVRDGTPSSPLKLPNSGLSLLVSSSYSTPHLITDYTSQLGHTIYRPYCKSLEAYVPSQDRSGNGDLFSRLLGILTDTFDLAPASSVGSSRSIRRRERPARRSDSPTQEVGQQYQGNDGG